jgi:putative phosphoribosyl transferase
VDDGVATGATARAAARALRPAGAARLVLAAPVIAAPAVEGLRADFDEVVAVELPEVLLAVGVWYERYGEVDEDEAAALLAPGGGPTRAPEVGAGAGDVTPDTPRR